MVTAFELWLVVPDSSLTDIHADDAKHIITMACWWRCWFILQSKVFSLLHCGSVSYDSVHQLACICELFLFTDLPDLMLVRPREDEIRSTVRSCSVSEWCLPHISRLSLHIKIKSYFKILVWEALLKFVSVFFIKKCKKCNSGICTQV